MEEEEVLRKEVSALKQESDACQRCGSKDLELRDLDHGRSSFSQILKCNACGTETLIPWREKIQEPEAEQSTEEEQAKRDWRVLAE